MEEKKCAFQDCTLPYLCKGWCSGHYYQVRRQGYASELIKYTSNKGKPCGVEGCAEGASRRGYCPKHASRFYKYGDPLGKYEYKHGAAGYERGCRCDICVEDRKRIWAKNKLNRQNSEPPEHGTRSAYWNWGCRCDLCKEASKGFNREVQRRYRFGLEEKDFLNLLEGQEFKCYICKKDFDLEDTRNIAIDHNHTCCPTSERKTCGNCIRSALCIQCNTALGMVYEDVETLKAMINYIENPPNYKIV